MSVVEFDAAAERARAKLMLRVARTVNTRRAAGLLPPPRSGQLLWGLCCAGREPAEALHPRDREDLVASLVAKGWTDTQIAVLTRMSTYTTVRIRVRLGLPANTVVEAAA